MAKFPVNINAMRWSYYDPATVCADIFPFQCSYFRASEVQTTLAEDYTAGDPYMVLADPRKFWGEGSAYGQVITIGDYKAQVKPPGLPIFQFAGRIVVGSNKLFVTSISAGTDTDCPAGSLVDNMRSNWNNSQGLPIADPLTVEGIDTGWPKGLSTGQSISLLTHSGLWKPTGAYTVTMPGTGQFAIQCPGQSYKTITFNAGVPTGSNTFNYDGSANTVWLMTITQSNASDPFRHPRIIAPGTLADGTTTYVQDYAAHADEPGYRRWYRPYQQMFADFDFGLLRDVNTQPINLGNPRTNTDVAATEDGQYQAGMSTETGPSVEDFLRFPLSMGMNAWWAILPRWTDQAVTNFGNRADAILPSGKKLYVEYINEIWNWGYGHKPWAIMKWGLELIKCSIVRSGSTATVTKAAHGFANGDTVIVTGALQPEYNGEFMVADATTDTFTYAVSGSPASPASTTDDGRVMVYRATTLVKSLTSVSATLASTGLSFNVVFPAAPGYLEGDFLSFSGFADPKMNGVLRISEKLSNTTYRCSLTTGGIRPIPEFAAGTTDMVAAEGQSLKCRIVIPNVSTTETNNAGIPGSDEAAARWSGRRHAQVHAILAPILGDKLVRVVGGWSNSPLWNERVLDQYKKDNGGTFPAGTKLSIAPYFYASSSLPNKADEATLVSLLAGGMSQSDALDLLFASVEDFITSDNRVAGIKAALPEGVGLIMYEFGQHLSALNENQGNQALVDLYIAFNRDARIEALYDTYLAKLGDDGVDEGNHYSFLSSFDKFGSWGLYEYQGQADTPKATALKNFIHGEDPDPDPPSGDRRVINLEGGRVVHLKAKVVA